MADAYFALYWDGGGGFVSLDVWPELDQAQAACEGHARETQPKKFKRCGPHWEKGYDDEIRELSWELAAPDTKHTYQVLFTQYHGH